MVVTVTPAVEFRRFTRVEYARLLDCGILQEGDRLELIDGLLILREPQYSPHAVATQLALQALDRAFDRSAGPDAAEGRTPDRR